MPGEPLPQNTIDAYVGKMGGGYSKHISVPMSEVGIRAGTPISELSGRPGHRGFAEFSRIAREWGYD